MSDLQHQARQTKALARKKRNKASMRRARKQKQAQRVPRPSPERIRARAKTERFEVHPDLTWVVVRSDRGMALKCAQALRKAGFPVFEARVEERVVADSGKARVAQIPVLRRLMFVGMMPSDRAADLVTVRYLDAVWAEGEGSLLWVPRDWLASARAVAIGPLAMQKFADHITGHRRDDQEVRDIVEALFLAGDQVRVTDGPFSGFAGPIQDIVGKRGRYKIDVTMLGGTISLELNENQLEAA